MDGLVKAVADALIAYRGKKIAVGVSGGRDSVCLLHAVCACGVTRSDNILAVHVNHCLRQTADRDEAFVRELCALLGVKLTCVRVDVKRIAERTCATVEQAARGARYDAFLDLLSRGAADVVLTAHHALDNAESVLMHLFRGSGLDGLRGMAAGRDGFLRPLLGVYPDEIARYVADNGLDYVTDETNYIDDADRNYIRLNVLPLVERRYSGAVRAINGLSRECARAVAELDASLDLGLISRRGGATVIADAALKSGLADRYVRAALGYFTRTDVTREQTARVIALADMRRGAVAELSSGIVASRDYDGVALYVPRPRCTERHTVRPGANFIGGLAVDVTDCACTDIGLGGVCDYDKIVGATLRFRRDGDVFTPFGGVEKKLARYFIDCKTPLRERDRIPLLCDGSKVLAVIGMQISDGIKITPATVRAVRLSRRW